MNRCLLLDVLVLEDDDLLVLLPQLLLLERDLGVVGLVELRVLLEALLHSVLVGVGLLDILVHLLHDLLVLHNR